MTTINPTRNNVAIRPLDQAEKTAAGVFLPEQLQKKLQEAVVLELGPKVDQSLFAVPLEVGSRVLFSRYAGTWIKLAQGEDAIGSGDIMLVEDRDVLCQPT